MLIIAVIIHILTRSRFNLDLFSTPRSLYDKLSILLPVSFIVFYFLSPLLIPYEKKVERAVARMGRKWLPLLIDSLVIVLAVIFIYKATRKIFFNAVSCSTANMLPIIRGAGERLLSLKNPFSPTFCSYQGGFPYLPMMMIYYLPALALKIDIRIVSLFFFLCLSLSGYIFYRRKGYLLTGCFIFFFLVTSKLIPLFLLTVHTFPYLFVFSVVLLAFSEDNDKALFFSLALALASRKFFWLYLPFFVIYLLKSRKITLPNLKLFALGGLLGFFPYILFPGDFIKSNMYHISNASQDLNRPLFLKHSLGLTYHFLNLRTLSLVILVVLYGLIILMAVKFLNKRNLWFFLSLSFMMFLYFQVFTRTQEYYFLPLIIILMFAPLEDSGVVYKKKHLPFLGIPVMLCLVLIFLCFPYLSGTTLHIHPLQRGEVISTGEIRSNGYLELSLGGNLRSMGSLTFSMRRMNAHDNEPVRVKMTINDQDYWDEIYQTGRIEIPIDQGSQKKYFFRGGNSVRISLDKRENFTLRIKRGLPVDTK